MSKYSYAGVSFFIFFIFLVFSCFSFSINTIHSSYQLFFWALYGCAFIVSIGVPINFRYIKNIVLFIFLISSFLFIGRSLNPTLFPFLSTSPYQFILRVAGEHNHLGDLAGLVFVSLILSSSHLLLIIPSSLFAFVIMAISFSKSAFLGALVVLFILAIQKKEVYRIIFSILFCISLLVITLYTKEASSIPFVKQGQKIMSQTLHLNPKPLLSVRDFYYPQVIRAWQTSPLEQLLFGYGSGNYIYSSIKTGVSSDLTPTETHNIFLSLFVENGILTLFWFLIFCTYIVIQGLKQENPFIYLFIYLLVNFQTDFTYAMPFFMVLFFIFAGQSLPDARDKMSVKSSFFFFSLFCMIGLTIFLGLIYMSILNNKKQLDVKLQSAFKSQDKQKIQETINSLEAITPFEEAELVKWSFIQEFIGNTKEAIRLLEKLSVYSPRWYLLSLSHQLDLQKKDGIDIKQYLEKKRGSFSQFPFTEKERIQLNNICAEHAKIQCVR